MSKQITVEPTGMLVGDKIVDPKPYSQTKAKTKATTVKTIDYNPRWSCGGVHINGTSCFTLPVVVERS